MRISETPNASPHSTPPSGPGSRGGADAEAADKLFVWTSLVPRLVHPTKLAIVEALIAAGRPLSVEELVPQLPAVDGNTELIRYHANSMVRAGALVVAVEPEAAADVHYFYFPSTA
jgi:hypothetical protein